MVNRVALTVNHFGAEAGYMPTHDARCAYHVLYRCKRCGKLSLSRGTLERSECPAGHD